MGAKGALLSIADAVRRLFARPAAERINIVAWRPLHAGGVLYVADFDRRRHAFVVAPNSVCVLASYAIEGAHATGPSYERAEADTGEAGEDAGLEVTGVESGSV